MPNDLTPSDIERFWSKVDKNGPVPAHRPELGPCWLWTAGRSSSGYGVIWLRRWKNNHGTHRVSFYLSRGYWPLNACHECDNPPCCNPSHIFDGTLAENMDDCVQKGRRDHLKGTGNFFAVLTELDVQEIREIYAAGGRTQESIAKQFGVSQDNVSLIVNRKHWRHLL